MISKRLLTLAGCINKQDKVVDVGCDHGYLSIYLVKHVHVLNIIASDINQNALNNAISNIKKEGLEKQIKTVLSDGLENVPRDIDTVIISGMGTQSIINILNKAELDNITKLVVQSNNNLFSLRQNIVNLGFYISKEFSVYENKKYYIIIEFLKGKKKYSKKELEYGPLLLKNKENKPYFRYLLKKQEEIWKRVPKNKSILIFKIRRKIRFLKKLAR